MSRPTASSSTPTSDNSSRTTLAEFIRQNRAAQKASGNWVAPEDQLRENRELIHRFMRAQYGLAHDLGNITENIFRTAAGEPEGPVIDLGARAYEYKEIFGDGYQNVKDYVEVSNSTEQADRTIKKIEESDTLRDAAIMFNEYLVEGRKAAKENSGMVIKWLQGAKEKMHPMICVLALEQNFNKLLKNIVEPDFNFMTQVEKFIKTAQEGLERTLTTVDKLQDFKIEEHSLVPTETSSLLDYLERSGLKEKNPQNSGRDVR
jgi:hypothetical protein